MNILEEEIETLLQRQIRVTFMGKDILNAREVYSRILKDNECCMRDYIMNDCGILVQVNYDIVRDE